jgi:hypothetical protein
MAGPVLTVAWQGNTRTDLRLPANSRRTNHKLLQNDPDSGQLSRQAG